MAKPKQQRKQTRHTPAKRRQEVRRTQAPDDRLPTRTQWIPQPRGRRLLGDPNPVTWWRWRQKPEFPKPKVINGRLYFLWGELADWWANHPDRQVAAA